MKGVCHTHPEEGRGASPTLARGAGEKLPTQWRAWWGAPRGGGGERGGGDGRARGCRSRGEQQCAARGRRVSVVLG